MTFHIETGKKGEDLACNFLLDRKYNILFRNWKYKNIYEIDIVAEKNGTIHFIEVKTRTSIKYGHPEESVSLKKFKNLQRGAEAFQVIYPGVKKIQFDVVSILLLPGKGIDIFFIEDVFLG